MEQSLTPEERLQAWFDNPQTPVDAWKEWSIDDIASDAGVSSTSVEKYLANIVKVKYPEIENYLVFKETRQEAGRLLYKKGERLPDKDIARIQELRKRHTIYETAALTGFSPGVVQKYSSKRFLRL